MARFRLPHCIAGWTSSAWWIRIMHWTILSQQEQCTAGFTVLCRCTYRLSHQISAPCRLPPSFFVSVDNRYGVTYSHTRHRHRGNTHGPAFYFIDSLNTAARCWGPAAGLGSSLLEYVHSSSIQHCMAVEASFRSKSFWRLLSKRSSPCFVPPLPSAWLRRGGRDGLDRRPRCAASKARCWLRRLWVARGAFFEQVSGVRKSSSATQL